MPVSRRGGARTDVKLVVVAAEAVRDSLLDCSLVTNNPIGLAVLRRLLPLGRTGDALRKVGAIRFRTKVEGTAL